MKPNNREGNKYRYKDKIISMFPNHDCYIEPFFGTGVIFFNKELAKYNLLNDTSKFIYNLYSAIQNNIDDLYERVYNAFVYDDIINENQDKVEYQLLNVLTSIYNNASKTMILGSFNEKSIFLARLKEYGQVMLDKLRFSRITNKDVLDFLNAISLHNCNNIFVYCDPPYSISKGNLNDNKGWDISRLKQLVEWFYDNSSKKYKEKIKFAISEYNDKEVVELFKSHNLYINEVNKATGLSHANKLDKYEILATNYAVQNNMFGI